MMPFDDGGLPPPPHIWIVEMQIGDHWQPTLGIAFSKKACVEVAKDWRARNQSAFRVAKYVAEKR
jgi:hypothetical protein